MKILKSILAFAIVAATTVSVMAQETTHDPATHKIYVKDFAIKKGETKTVEILLDNPTYVATATQFDIKFKGGITIDGNEGLTPTSRVPTKGFSDASDWVGTGDNKVYRVIVSNMKGNEITGTSGAIFEIDVFTTDDFGKEPASIEICGEVKLSHVKDAAQGAFDINGGTNQVFEAKSLADILTCADGANYYVADALKVVGKSESKGYAFATDGNNNWIKLELGEGVTMTEGVSYEGEQFGGVLSGAGVNPSIKIENALGVEEAEEAVAGEVEKIDMTHSFSMLSNQVVSVTGYYFNDDAQETLRAFSGQNGERGQSLTVNTEWGETVMTNATPYTIKKAAVQLKAAWEAAPEGAAIAANDEFAFQNYIIYPLEKAEIATAVEDVNASKSVSSVRYYNVAGVEAAAPFQGVNLVVTTYTDGTTSTAKVIK